MVENDRHNYEYDVDLEGPSAPARVVRMVGKNKNVLEIGAGPGSITKYLVRANNCKVTAIEIDKTAIKKLSEFTDTIYSADLNDDDWPRLVAQDGMYEVIVAGDVLEHLYNPWNTLKLMKGLLKDEGQIVISVPHVGHNSICACLLNENFDYRDWGLLDRTHIRFFGLKNIQEMFEQAGLTITHAEFVIIKPEETEFAESWNKLESHVQSALSENKFGTVYQVVIKAVKNTERNSSINLMSLPVEISENIHETKQINTSSFRTIAVRYLPANVKIWLKNYLR